MRPLTLKEFAEDMRRKGDIRESDLADEILSLIDIESDVAEPYSELCADLENYAPKGLRDKPSKALEWLGDRSNMLDEISMELERVKRTGDIDDEIKNALGTLEQAEDILRANGWQEGDFLDALHALAERAAPLEYDL